MKENSASSIAQEAAVLTVNGVCAHLNLSRSSVYKLLKSGELKRVRIAGRTLVRRSDADELIARSIVA